MGPPAAARFFLLLFQDGYRVLRQRQRPVGVLRLERGFHYLAIDPGDLPFHPEVAMFEIDVLPLQAE